MEETRDVSETMEVEQSNKQPTGSTQPWVNGKRSMQRKELRKLMSRWWMRETMHKQEVEIVLRRIVLRRGRGRTGEIRQRRRENGLMVVIAAWSKQ